MRCGSGCGNVIRTERRGGIRADGRLVEVCIGTAFLEGAAVCRRFISQSRQLVNRAIRRLAEEYLTALWQKVFAPRLNCAGPRDWEIA